MPDTVDLEGIQDVVAEEAPVFDPEPLSGKEKAGVSLTWGIIGVLVIFLLLILAVFLWGEIKFMECFEQLGDLKEASSEKINDIVTYSNI